MGNVSHKGLTSLSESGELGDQSTRDNGKDDSSLYSQNWKVRTKRDDSLKSIRNGA